MTATSLHSYGVVGSAKITIAVTTNAIILLLTLLNTKKNKH